MTKIITVGFYKGDSFIAKAIKWYTKSEFSHCEILIDGESFIADFGINLTKYKLNEYPSEKWVQFDIPVECSVQDFEIIKRYLNDQIGAKYDSMGIFLSQLFPLGINSNSKWFCSEFVTKILQLFLVEEVLDLQCNKVSPGALFNILKRTQIEIEPLL